MEIENRTTTPLQVLLVMRRALDLDAYGLFVQHTPGMELVAKTNLIEHGVSMATVHQPCITILDAEYPNATSSQFAKSFLSHSNTAALLVLDRNPREACFLELIPFKRVSYLTREISSIELIDAIFSTVSGIRILDPSICGQVIRKEGTDKFQPKPGQISLALLTSRERDIFQLLAEGHSVKEAALRLDLAQSTVDNHKWRVMRKLNVHKSSELTRVAIQLGLIDI